MLEANGQPLCDVVKAELYRAFGEEAVAAWSIELAEENECCVRSEDFLLIFYFDIRDKTLSSSIVFTKEDEWVRERLYIHIISRIIPYFYKSQYIDNDEKNTIVSDVDTIAKILSLVKEDKLSPRDLLYFYFGYNSGYGDRRKAL